MSALHGWIILDKPYGLGSTQAVAAVKRCLREAGYPKVKIGHGGTLDPLASGVLPIALGEATKLAGRMLDSDKAYDFCVKFGEKTDTLDAEGVVIATSDARPALAEVEAILPRFTGPIEQMPPAYSALKVDGRRAYDLARAGEEVTLKTRAVTIHALEVLACDAECVTLSATVSKGTYIRSLARDIALALGTVGHVTMLRRTKAGPFTLKSAISLDKITQAAKGRTIVQYVLPLTVGLDDIPALPVTPDQALALRQGKVLAGDPRKQGLMLATEGQTPIALVEGSGLEIRVVRGFNL
ncbi:tRNA pseudouridine(55) synthase TruB [Sphingobium sp. DEHP117]|uniref:tRNA pseudouridine(55) synthase TruB n=1 Tax=Sphingobium sp. DEHP117 TaxID=2993436 RepID=UPI0027D5A1CC|nr:tRNA pseudouridine(55) synthase TruB [Sphingobium sp. DEHP117]MDQ4420294.1 tRNA pseudouridine(55) synthase TruB [Sphingobium sp. DEHP117]